MTSAYQSKLSHCLVKRHVIAAPLPLPIRGVERQVNSNNNNIIMFHRFFGKQDDVHLYYRISHSLVFIQFGSLELVVIFKSQWVFQTRHILEVRFLEWLWLFRDIASVTSFLLQDLSASPAKTSERSTCQFKTW